MIKVIVLFAALCVVSQVGAMPGLSPIQEASAMPCGFCEGLLVVCQARMDAGDYWEGLNCFILWASLCGGAEGCTPDPNPPEGSCHYDAWGNWVCDVIYQAKPGDEYKNRGSQTGPQPIALTQSPITN